MKNLNGNSENKVVAVFFISDINSFKQRSLLWAQQYSIVAALDNNLNKNQLFQSNEFLLAVGAKDEIPESNNCFSTINDFFNKSKEWKFGFLCYDIKNEIEDLQSKNEEQLKFPLTHFFNPETLIRITGSEAEIISSHKNVTEIFYEINSVSISEQHTSLFPEIKTTMPDEEYLMKVEKIKEYITEGDVYELNLCREFYCENYKCDPLQLYFKLNETSLAPYSVFYKLNSKYLLCASPERFLKKDATKIISQPIKGTIRRSEDEQMDIQLRSKLLNSEKDRAENVMIVDLVRNDLSRSCVAGSVIVEELFGIYTYPKVHQMVSTVCGDLRNEIAISDALKNAFPMGSMTGAPKIRAMQLIDELENSKRGLFSGAVGYITPENDFDFNVVIRSILYDAENKYLSFSAGGAITIDSNPQSELEEILLKTEAVRNIL